MILIDVEVYNNVKKLYELFEAIVDTGATFCVMAEHIARKMGVVPREKEGKIHLWQVDGPLVLSESIFRIRYREKEQNVEVVIVSLCEDYLRLATPNEICERPTTPHPLTSRIILGKSFLDKLGEGERKEILVSSFSLPRFASSQAEPE